MKMIASLFKRHWPFVVFISLALFVRFYHFDQVIYFIYDQGRDAWKLKSILDGDLTLIGPTTGLAGFFLGPLWYYLGLPGYLLSQGNPYGISLWFIFIASLSLPCYWYISRQLFKNNLYSLLCAFILAFIPGSILASTFIWNPIMSLPLMSLAVIFLINSRKSETSFLLGILCIFLTLQSEFAYAIFYVVTLVPLTFWFTGKKSLGTLIKVILVGLVTLIPQIIFELKNHFLMSKSLFQSLSNTKDSISLAQIFAQRPIQLYEVTAKQFLQLDQFTQIGFSILVIFFLLALARITIKEKEFKWHLVAILSVIPFVGYMFWKGNHGYFFDYYLTSHFILVTPLIVYGIESMANWLKIKNQMLKFIPALLVFGLIFISLIKYLTTFVIFPSNQAGLKVIETSVATIYKSIKELNATHPAVRIYTPNIYTEQYDYLIYWYATKHKLHIPQTTIDNQTDYIYILAEPENQYYQERYLPWHKQATINSQLIKSEKIGALLLEIWKK